ncbi:MAG: hypothetical protein MZV64_12795 [Ignavibacteriales bacterium]|nr:hypothetical protein [Ignavibacteriales bacterium]
MSSGRPILDELRRAGRQVRPGGPSDRDRLRPLHDAAPARHLQRPADPRLQLRPQPPRLAGHRAAPLHPRLRRPRSTTST